MDQLLPCVIQHGLLMSLATNRLAGSMRSRSRRVTSPVPQAISSTSPARRAGNRWARSEPNASNHAGPKQVS
jgi:hypothetical protein